jgi:hypothetical protein
MQMQTFFRYSIIVDFMYIAICYFMIAYYGLDPMNGFVSDFVDMNPSAFDPADFHSFAMVVLQLFFVISFTLMTLKDQEQPDYSGMGKTASWDKLNINKNAISYTGIANRIATLGIQAGLIISMYGVVSLTLSACFIGLFILISCYWLAMANRD